MQTDHGELARRVETDQPSRELDCAVAVASGEYLTGTGREGMLAHRDTPNQFSFHVPRYTTSIDAALSLVPEGWRVNLSEWDDEEHLRPAGPWQCILSVAGTCHANPFDARCDHAQTPAQAITAAALRARALKEAK